MALYVIATPIGDLQDIGLRARALLADCDVIIGEEAKELRARLKHWGIAPQKDIRLLNEHSNDGDVAELVGLCQQLKVALVSDCGTPGFFDPGPELIKIARAKGVSVWSVPGAACLTAFISVAGHRFNEFHFAGFLPANEEMRQPKWNELAKLKIPIFLLDTPYRFKKVVEELKRHFPAREVILGMDLGGPEERIMRSICRSLDLSVLPQKPEFILAILP